LQGALRSYHEFCGRRWIWIVGALALFVFSASMGSMSLKSDSDCFYAQKGWEMAESGPSFTVTWDQRPEFGYPPLHFWIMAGLFRLFGKSDFAARLPSLLMGLGMLLATYRVAAIAGGRRTAIAATAVLMLTPVFVSQSRRCMTDIPLAFWTTIALLVYLEGLKRPKLLALFAVPLGAAVLTKSLLGLMPLLVIPAGLVSPALRRPLRSGWFWTGALGGLALGAVWPIHQLLTVGREFLRLHYDVVILARAVQKPSGGVLTGYPLILVEHFQPLVFPALAGLVLFLKDRFRARTGSMDFMIAWLLIPLIVYSVAEYRFPRYVFPLLPTLAFFAGYVFERRLRRTFIAVTCYVMPILTIASTLVFWVDPSLLGRDWNQSFKQNVEVARAHLEEGTTLPYVGDEYWPEANPLLWYWNVRLEKPGDSAAQAVEKALARPDRSLICVRERIDEIRALGVPHEIVVESKHWSWLRFAESEEPGSGERAGENETRAREPLAAHT